MPVADTFPPASFDGIEFSYAERSLKGSLRHYTHEYPHAEGGDDEPLGRKLYEIGFTCDFDEAFNDRFPGLYPDRLNQLRAKFEQQTVGPLEVPGIANFSARCVDWDQRLTARIRSGEKVSFKFIEVFDVQIVQENFDTAVEGLAPQMNRLKVEVERLRAAPLGALPVNAIPTDRDLADLANLDRQVNGLLSSKAATGITVVRQAQAVIDAGGRIDPRPYLRYSRAAQAVDALHNVMRSAIVTRKDSERRSLPLLTYVTDRRLSIMEVATTLYGDTKRVNELLRINFLRDALSIPSGTEIQYYPKGTAARAA